MAPCVENVLQYEFHIVQYTCEENANKIPNKKSRRVTDGFNNYFLNLLLLKTIVEDTGKHYHDDNLCS